LTLRYLQQRDGRYEYRRYIPPKVRHLFGFKTEIVISFGTRDACIAASMYADVHRKYDAVLKAAKFSPEKFDHNDLKTLVSDVGIVPFPDDVETAPILDLIELTARNMEATEKLQPKIKLGAISMALSDRLTLNQVYDRYLILNSDKDLKRTKREKDKSRKPIELAIKECSAAIGALDVRKLRKADAHVFRQKLISDVQAGKITASTANKKIMHVRKIVGAVFTVDYPDLANPFAIEQIEVNSKGHRAPFSELDVETAISQLHLSDLNEQLKTIILVSMYTGAGCKEIALLTGDDIVLTGPYPYIRIGANEFRVKVKNGANRHRKVPLYGDALDAIRKFPNGFDRYARDGGGEAVSAAANKFLKRVTGKTFYSFRHRLADLLRNSGCEDQVRNAIFGHKQSEMPNHYGDGYILKTMYEALERAHELGKTRLKESQEIYERL
jgi:integrase